MTTDRPGPAPAAAALPVPPQVRADQLRVGARTLASLVASRAAYRLITLATTVLLLPIWGAERYHPYAAALASFSWLLPLVLIGPEKTVLKLLPRAPRVGRMVTDALGVALWLLPVPLAAGYLLALATGGAGPAALRLGVVAMVVSVGCTQLLVGLHRARGRPRADMLTFLTMSLVELVLLAAAAAGRLGPVGFVGWVVAGQLTVNLVLSAALGRPSLRIRRRPRLLARLGWTVLFLGGADLFILVTTAVLFTILGGSAHADQLGRFYAVVLVFTAGLSLLLYLLRVIAPQTALRLTGRAGAAGRARAARLARLVVAANALWLAGVAALAATTGLVGVATSAGQLLLWSVLLATRAPGMVALLWASFVLENTDATAARVVAVAGLAGLVAATLIGLVVVPAAGAVGVLAAVAAGELGYALVVARGADRRRRPGRRSPAEVR